MEFEESNITAMRNRLGQIEKETGMSVKQCNQPGVFRRFLDLLYQNDGTTNRSLPIHTLEERCIQEAIGRWLAEVYKSETGYPVNYFSWPLPTKFRRSRFQPHINVIPADQLSMPEKGQDERTASQIIEAHLNAVRCKDHEALKTLNNDFSDLVFFNVLKPHLERITARDIDLKIEYDPKPGGQ